MAHHAQAIEAIQLCLLKRELATAHDWFGCGQGSVRARLGSSGLAVGRLGRWPRRMRCRDNRSRKRKVEAQNTRTEETAKDYWEHVSDFGGGIAVRHSFADTWLMISAEYAQQQVSMHPHRHRDLNTARLLDCSTVPAGSKTLADPFDLRPAPKRICTRTVPLATSRSECNTAMLEWDEMHFRKAAATRAS